MEATRRRGGPTAGSSAAKAGSATGASEAPHSSGATEGRHTVKGAARDRQSSGERERDQDRQRKEGGRSSKRRREERIEDETDHKRRCSNKDVKSRGREERRHSRDEAGRDRKDRGRDGSSRDRREAAREEKTRNHDDSADRKDGRREKPRSQERSEHLSRTCGDSQIGAGAPLTFQPQVLPLGPSTSAPSDCQKPSIYLLLHNAFAPFAEEDNEVHLDVRDDFHTECSKGGLVVHNTHVITRAGSLLFKFDSIVAAVKAKEKFEGCVRDGRVITCSFMHKSWYTKRFGL